MRRIEELIHGGRRDVVRGRGAGLFDAVELVARITTSFWDWHQKAGVPPGSVIVTSRSLPARVVESIHLTPHAVALASLRSSTTSYTTSLLSGVPWYSCR